MEENVIQNNTGIIINVGVSLKKHNICERLYHLVLYNPATCNCENGKYLATIMDDSVVICDEAKESYDEETKPIPINFNEKTYKTQSFYILLIFLLITIKLLKAVSIYCYLIKKSSKTKTKTFITIFRRKINSKSILIT